MIQELSKVIDTSPDPANLLAISSDKCLKISQTLNWSSIIKAQLEIIGVDDWILDWLPDGYKHSKLPRHLHMIDISHSIGTLGCSQALYFSEVNKNCITEQIEENGKKTMIIVQILILIVTHMRK